MNDIYMENIGDEDANYWLASFGSIELASGRDYSKVLAEANYKLAHLND